LTRVIVEPDESFESALEQFKKPCEVTKPSARRKRKALVARKKAKRRERTSD
jgi:ribosomal protein S21